jgi:hypothetical protein
VTPVTLRPEAFGSCTILASAGAATSVKTTGMSVMCCPGTTASYGPTTPSVTDVPHA